MNNSDKIKLKKRIETIVLFTSIFPFGSGENFLETEVKVLSEEFQKIIIVSSDEHSLMERILPGNVTVIRKKIILSKLDKLLSIFGLFSRTTIKDFKKNKSKFSFVKRSNLNYLLISFYKRKLISDFILFQQRLKKIKLK